MLHGMLIQVRRTDLIFFCPPNNPTWAAAMKKLVGGLVALVIYDAPWGPLWKICHADVAL